MMMMMSLAPLRLWLCEQHPILLGKPAEPPPQQAPHQAPPLLRAQQVAAPPVGNPSPIGDVVVNPPGQVDGGAAPT